MFLLPAYFNALCYETIIKDNDSLHLINVSAKKNFIYMDGVARGEISQPWPVYLSKYSESIVVLHNYSIFSKKP